MDNDLSKSKIININDFIFRQNLEFYPNLTGLTCIDNTIHFKPSTEILASEVLTFDLRTLPGEAWNVTPEEFMGIIKLNKECKGLYKFIELLEHRAYDTFLKPVYEGFDSNREQVSRYMATYFNAKDQANLLTEDNKILVSKVEEKIVNLPEGALKTWINSDIDEYYNKTKELGDTSTMNNLDNLRQGSIEERGPVKALVKKEDGDVKESSQAAFINVAILLYGVLNIGIILAIAFLK